METNRKNEAEGRAIPSLSLSADRRCSAHGAPCCRQCEGTTQAALLAPVGVSPADWAASHREAVRKLGTRL